MLELYFLLWRIPREIGPLARQRGRSALAWSLAAIAAWLAAEAIAILGVVAFFLVLPLEIDPALVAVLAYVFAVWAAMSAAQAVRNQLAKGVPAGVEQPADQAAAPEPPPIVPSDPSSETRNAVIAWLILGAVFGFVVLRACT